MTRDEPITIKKYANRRLYHTGTSSYVTLDDLAKMVKNGEEFVVVDAKTGGDITRAVLGQIIFEQENKGEHLLPIAVLRQLIKYYGDSMQAFVPSYLETSLAAFQQDQDKLREQLSKAFQGDAFELMEEQARRNMDMFSEAIRMWMPFGTGAAAGETGAAKPGPDKTGGAKDELEALREQLRSMQDKIDSLADKD